ncbi:hypothetical protein RC083_17380 [Pseudoalteromonas haloplanktis]|uniref:Uncharacterized protein n=1 Tax=Pseudoalteromonas haloplanktis TaxID=228 RepID=A0ABU1BHG0_PSEHA|nr:hypothetical protein [Pseudoalteromonas haloplanktis]MDQ9093354.1 hypothetical protein [Pseudoalteromonas haloplanktis]
MPFARVAASLPRDTEMIIAVASHSPASNITPVGRHLWRQEYFTTEGMSRFALHREEKATGYG